MRRLQLLKLPTRRITSAFQSALLAWYAKHGRSFPWRRSSRKNYELVVAEILLKRTRAENLSLFYLAFIKRYPSWEQLASASRAELETFLRPIGLWRQRAASLRALANAIALRGGRIPRNRDQVESLPGVGQYVANAIMLFCNGSNEPLLDSSMARVLERCFGKRKLVDIRYDPWLQALAKHAVQHDNAAHLNWAILDLAAKVCHARIPKCHECPVQNICQHSRISSEKKHFARTNSNRGGD